MLLLYLAVGPVALSYGVRAWGAYGRTGRMMWFWVGLALCACGVDAVALLHREIARSPSYQLAWPMTGVIAFAVGCVAWSTWRRVSTPVVQVRPPWEELEEPAS